MKAFTEPGSVVGFYPVFSGDLLLGTAFSMGGNVILTQTDAIASVYELLSWMLANLGNLVVLDVNRNPLKKEILDLGHYLIPDIDVDAFYR